MSDFDLCLVEYIRSEMGDNDRLSIITFETS